MGQSMRTQMVKNFYEKNDIKAIRSGLHYFVLLGVSIYVFIDMENNLNTFKLQLSSTMSEREYERQEMYKDIMNQIKEYDGDGPGLGVPETDLPDYRYEIEDD
jgi:hypothetical protein